jgi:hypothetical protein
VRDAEETGLDGGRPDVGDSDELLETRVCVIGEPWLVFDEKPGAKKADGRRTGRLGRTSLRVAPLVLPRIDASYAPQQKRPRRPSPKRRRPREAAPARPSASHRAGD